MERMASPIVSTFIAPPSENSPKPCLISWILLGLSCGGRGAGCFQPQVCCAGRLAACPFSGGEHAKRFAIEGLPVDSGPPATAGGSTWHVLLACGASSREPRDSQGQSVLWCSGGGSVQAFWMSRMQGHRRCVREQMGGDVCARLS